MTFEVPVIPASLLALSGDSWGAHGSLLLGTWKQRSGWNHHFQFPRHECTRCNLWRQGGRCASHAGLFVAHLPRYHVRHWVRYPPPGTRGYFSDPCAIPYENKYLVARYLCWCEVVHPAHLWSRGGFPRASARPREIVHALESAERSSQRIKHRLPQRKKGTQKNPAKTSIFI